jgi:S1-C subfamily serine protease
VPVAAIETVVASLQQHGKIRRGFLGIGAQAVRLPAALAQAHGVGREQGLLVVAIEPDGPAERDGVILGDVIVAIDGDPVSEVEELQDKLSGDRVGRTLPLLVLRGGDPREVNVTIADRPS